MRAALVVCTSDWHTNSTIGLCPSRVTLDEGGEYVASPAQRWIWRNWLTFWRETADIAKREKLPVVSIVNGDIADGDHHATPQIISRNKATQLKLVTLVARPMLDVAEHVFVVRGTEAHTGKSAWIEEKFADDIGAVRFSDDLASWWTLRTKLGGVVFDVQHHPEGGGKVPWGRAGAAGKIAASVMFDCAERGEDTPDIAIRSHIHEFRDSGLTYRTRAFVLPPWQLSTAFGHRIGVGGRLQVQGGLRFICRNGKYATEFRRFEAKRDKPVTISLNTGG